MKQNELSIASVTVAYNGVTSLNRHLESLKRQSRRLDEIIVIDNGSTDGTRSLIAKEHPEVKLICLPENQGVGAALETGLSYAALEKSHNWVWLFDQDSEPEPEGLERLLSGLGFFEGTEESVAILAPTSVHPSSQTVYPGLCFERGKFVPVVADAASPAVQVDMVISSGTLIRKEAILRVGMPRADFFIDFVDFEYCLRLRRHDFKIVVIRESKLNHAIGDATSRKLFGRIRHGTNHAPWREYYMTRNETFTMWHFYSGVRTKAFTLYRIAWHMMDVFLFSRDRFACFAMIYRGFVDGRAGRLGARFLPQSDKSSHQEESTTLDWRTP